MSNEILFRCSRLHGLLTEPRSKEDKLAGKLSDTAKGLVRDMWLEDKYGYKERVMTDQMYKGLLCEQDSMALIQTVLGGAFRVKCRESKSNAYIKGTCDIDLPSENTIEDIKSSYNLRTFFDAELDKDYYGQGQGYMELYGRRKYRLIYCLVPTPDRIILNEKKKLYYKFDCDEENTDYQQMCEQLDYNNDLILKIPPADRIKVFSFDYDLGYIDSIYQKIPKAREYYNSLTLNSID